MTFYIVEENWKMDEEVHDTNNDFFTSLDGALKFAELNRNTKDYFSNSHVRILEVYPEYNYVECLYDFYPELPYEIPDDYWYQEEPEVLFDPWDDYEYNQYLEEQYYQEFEDEWMRTNHNVPIDFNWVITLKHFWKLYSDWGFKFRGSTPLSKYNAFKWNKENRADKMDYSLLTSYNRLIEFMGESTLLKILGIIKIK